jgi:HK97 gp10 family phage protein
MAPGNEQLLLDAFKELGHKAIRRVTRAATSKAARYLAKQVRIKVKSMMSKGGPSNRGSSTKFVDSGGILLRSIGHKLYTARGTGHIGAVVGPRRGHSGYFYAYRRSERGKTIIGRIRSATSDFSGKPTKRTQKDLASFMKRNVVGKPVFRNPTRYAHLLEKGTSTTPPRPFLRPVRDANLHQVFNIMRNSVRDGLRREAAKLARKTAKYKRRGGFSQRRLF